MDGNVRFASVCLALVILQAGFGAYGVIYTKLAKGTEVEPLIFCFYRDGGCAPVLFLLSYFLEKRLLVPQVSDLGLFVAMGGIGMFGGQLFYIIGLINTTPDTASMFQPLTAVLCTIVAILMKVEKVPKLSERTGLAKVVGICLATLGALIMTYSKNSKHSDVSKDEKSKIGEPNLFGILCLLGNITTSSVWVVMQKKYIFNNPESRWRQFPINVTAWSYFFGALWMALASTYYINDHDKFHIRSKNVLYCLIYAIFVTSALCYGLITWCNMQVNASFVTASWPLQVVFCLTLSYIFLGETLTVVEVFSGLLIICALMAVTWSNYNERKPRIVNGKLLR
uniref:EamA domain-containing protein n=1 Tax=Clytia hemisphaerica TaxID=252671 RepID=A0A7M5V6G7_9CNID